MTLSAKDLETRKGRITGTSAAAVLGVHKYVTEFEAWQRITGRSPPLKQNMKMEFGQLVEPHLRDWYSKSQGVDLQEVDTIVPPHLPWLAGSTDGLGADRIWEGKSAGWRQAHRWGIPGSSEVPEEYDVQVRMYLAIFEKPFADVTVVVLEDEDYAKIALALLGGREINISDYDVRNYRIERDLELEAHILEVCGAWHAVHIVGDVPPPLDGSSGATDYLLDKFPRETRGEIGEARAAELGALALEHWRIDKALKSAEAAKDLIRNRAREILEGHDQGRGDWGSFTYRTPKPSKKFDPKAAIAAGAVPPDVVEAYSPVRPGRRTLRFSPKKKFFETTEGNDDE